MLTKAKTKTERDTLYAFWEFFYRPLLRTNKRTRIEIRFSRSSDFEAPERVFFDLDRSVSRKAPAFALAAAEYFPHQIHFCPAPEVLSDLSEGTGIRLSPGFWADFDFYESEAPITLNALIHMKACAVLSSGGGLHAYWRLEDIDAIRFHLLKNGFANAYGADLNIEIDHMMRFPCTMNFKYFPARRVRFLHFEPVETSFEQLAAHIESVLGPEWVKDEEDREREKQRSKEQAKLTSQRKDVVFSFGDITFDELFSKDGVLRTFFHRKSKQDIRCELIRRAVEYPEELSYKEWLTVGAVLFKAFPNDTRCMERLFHQVSALSVRYNESECSEVWRYIIEKNFLGWNCEALNVCHPERCGACRTHFTFSGTAATRLKAKRNEILRNTDPKDSPEIKQSKANDRRTKELQRVETLFEHIANEFDL